MSFITFGHESSSSLQNVWEALGAKSAPQLKQMIMVMGWRGEEEGHRMIAEAASTTVQTYSPLARE